MTDKEKKNQEIIEKAKKWVSSAAGQEAIEKAMKQSSKDIDELKKAIEIDPNEFDKPITL